MSLTGATICSPTPRGRCSAGSPGSPAGSARTGPGAAAPAPGRVAAAHRLGRALGHLSYARGFMVEGGQHYHATAARAPNNAAAVADLRLAADVALANMRGDQAFDLLVTAAERATTDPAARATALAFAVT